MLLYSNFRTMILCRPTRALGTEAPPPAAPRPCPCPPLPQSSCATPERKSADWMRTGETRCRASPALACILTPTHLLLLHSICLIPRIRCSPRIVPLKTNGCYSSTYSTTALTLDLELDPELFPGLIQHHPKHRLLYCRPCAAVLFPKGLCRHLQSCHRLPLAQRRLLLQHC